MRVFIFEFVTGGGWFLIDQTLPPGGSLLREGNAMLTSVVEDFAKLDEVRVTSLWDARLPAPRRGPVIFTPVDDGQALRLQFRRAVEWADVALVIAPEFNQYLVGFAEQVKLGGTLISPAPDFIRLTSNKHRTTQWLRDRLVPAPEGLLYAFGDSIPPDFSFPAVLKPIEGAGSLNVQLINDVAQIQSTMFASVSRLETFHAGTPASVAAIGGRHGFTQLPPCRQNVSGDGLFTYLGGSCPLEEPLAKRASRLAERAFKALPQTTGYVGIDMVLGEDPSGAGDVVIEVNPRLTTSYVGLRKIVRENLAAAMLSAAQGKPIELSTHPHRVEFSADGNVNILPE